MLEKLRTSMIQEMEQALLSPSYYVPISFMFRFLGSSSIIFTTSFIYCVDQF